MLLLNLNARDFSLAKRNFPTPALGDLVRDYNKPFRFSDVCIAYLELSQRDYLFFSIFLSVLQSTFTGENSQIKASTQLQSDYSVFPLLFLLLKKVFRPCFRLARSANMKEMHKPCQEAHPLFQPSVKVLDQWHLGIKVPTGAVV